MSPRPCRGGYGWGQCLLSPHNIYYLLLPFYLISPTPPLAPPLHGRGNIVYGIFWIPIPLVGSYFILFSYFLPMFISSSE